MNKSQAFKSGLAVTLGGRELRLAMDMNCMVELEEHLGGDPFQGSFWVELMSKFTPKRARILFWAMTRTFNPEVTLHEMGALLGPQSLDELLVVADRVQQVSLGNENVKKNSLASEKAGEKVATETQEQTGFNSGALQGSASGSPMKSLAE